MQKILFRKEKFSLAISKWSYGVCIGSDPQYSSESRYNAKAFYNCIDTEHWESSVKGLKKSLWKISNEGPECILIMEDIIE